MRVSGQEDGKVTARAALILEIAHTLPGVRNRWLKLARRHHPLFEQAVEIFEDFLAEYSDFESPV
jgi:hypothetical protein